MAAGSSLEHSVRAVDPEDRRFRFSGSRHYAHPRLTVVSASSFGSVGGSSRSTAGAQKRATKQVIEADLPAMRRCGLIASANCFLGTWRSARMGIVGVCPRSWSGARRATSGPTLYDYAEGIMRATRPQWRAARAIFRSRCGGFPHRRRGRPGQPPAALCLVECLADAGQFCVIAVSGFAP